LPPAPPPPPVFSSVIAYGGGGGGSLNSGIGAGNGASGGGEGGSGSSSWFSAGIATPKGQGNNGANNNGQVGGADPGGGGGGAGTVGLSPPSTIIAGNGGAGIASAISGTVTAYAGGGGGGYWTFGSTVASTGGVGGGAGGQTGPSTINGTNGTANTGGGGGAAVQGGVGGNGGSGIVIVSYPDVYAAPPATTGSPTVSKSGAGSLDFNGSSQFITYASNAAWALGSTFTLEFWTYPTAFSSGSNKRYFDTSNNGAGGFSLRTTGTGVVALDVSSTGQTTTNLSLNTWTHVAVVVTSGTLAIYFNGVAQILTGGGLTGINVTGTLGLSVGNFGTGTTYLYQGYLSNVRIVKGVAVYTGNFTPSTVPLQATQPAGTNIAAITGTSTGLLLNSVSGSSCADISTNGFGATSSPTIAPTWNASSPFTVTGYKNRVYTWTSSGSITF